MMNECYRSSVTMEDIHCPICSLSLKKMDRTARHHHVNSCLDGLSGNKSPAEQRMEIGRVADMSPDRLPTNRHGKCHPVHVSTSTDEILLQNTHSIVDTGEIGSEEIAAKELIADTISKAQSCMDAVDKVCSSTKLPRKLFHLLSNQLASLNISVLAMEKLMLSQSALTACLREEAEIRLQKLKEACQEIMSTTFALSSRSLRIIMPLHMLRISTALKRHADTVLSSTAVIWEIVRQGPKVAQPAGKYQIRNSRIVPERLLGPVASERRIRVYWWTSGEKIASYDIDEGEHGLILPQTPVADVTCLLATGNYLWTGHMDGSLGWWCTRSSTLLQYSPKILPSQPCHMVECNNKRLWVGTAKGGLFGIVAMPSVCTKDECETSSPSRFFIDCKKPDAHNSSITCMEASTACFWSTNTLKNSCCIRCWDAQRGSMISEWNTVDAVQHLVLYREQPNALYLLSVFVSGQIQVWNVSNPDLVTSMSVGPMDAVKGLGKLVNAFMVAGKFCQAYSTGVLLFWPQDRILQPQKLQPPIKLVAHKDGLMSASPLGAEGVDGILTTSCYGAIVYWTSQEIGMLIRVPESMQPEQHLEEFKLQTDQKVEDGIELKYGTVKDKLTTQVLTDSALYFNIRLGREIGEGGFGKVYHAKWGVVDVAVKMLVARERKQDMKHSAQASADQAQKLLSEALTIGSLRHPNILLFLGYSSQPTSIITEYCPRGSLYTVLHKNHKGELNWRLRLHMALGAAAGMAYLHNCTPAILHRDLKSPNILIDRNWAAKIADFNLSTMVQGSRHNSACGVHSPQWAAPEVLGEGTYTKASDVFSFGVILWEIMTFEKPWDGFSTWQIMHAVVVDDLRLDCHIARQNEGMDLVTPSLVSLIEKCWDSDPKKRPMFYQICRELESMICNIDSKTC